MALTRREGYADDWKPYLDTLPTNFRPWHPLTWLIPYDTSPICTPKTNTSTNDAEQENESLEDVHKNRKKRKRQSEVDGNEDIEQRRQWWLSLYANIPLSARKKVDVVKGRYEDDLVVLRNVLVNEGSFGSDGLEKEVTGEDLLWAWLIVNTRSVTLALGLPEYPPDVYNHTLVPLLDLLNHSSHPSVGLPHWIPTASSLPRVRTKNPSGPTPPALKNDGHSTFASKPYSGSTEEHLIPGKISMCLKSGKDMEEGVEVSFEYGGHGSEVLMAEYGFVEGPSSSRQSPISEIPGGSDASDAGAKLQKSGRSKSPRTSNVSPEVIKEGNVKDKDTKHNGKHDHSSAVARRWLEMPHAQVDLDHLIEPLWHTINDGDLKKDVLREMKYSGKNTIYANPSPAPSHSLLMTLRILHLTPEQKDKLDPIKKFLVTYVSPDNEEKVRNTLSTMCKEVVNDAEEALGSEFLSLDRARGILSVDISSSDGLAKYTDDTDERKSDRKGQSGTSHRRKTSEEGISEISHRMFKGKRSREEEVEVVGTEKKRKISTRAKKHDNKSVSLEDLDEGSRHGKETEGGEGIVREGEISKSESNLEDRERARQYVRLLWEEQKEVCMGMLKRLDNDEPLE
ncbi:hypothetical protein TREMEDRAFT_65667 [Tremella mesenterica DSM 1558]|uniref:uncharacterized protein n=1 Tax=Tremella mesenterica (strain ATCC 24925 / CBS 8224 / DSM 1558 / NBRC 9311 / NRRL Y-6157 / RJB 2259-6 / UBC 559-6) TaxID=578456 RepID=UPI00032BD22B|nr:uncharacterized protein TREMEDRAFT_65667 [Tremella mesenterica DSM 1558]EIW66384.1 hypothetical protein TREMEDRAFT_65667 [Tremella mesenterica DSM 1558]